MTGCIVTSLCEHHHGDVYNTRPHAPLAVNCHPHVHVIFPQDGRTALYQASAYGHDKVVDLLANAGAAVDVQEEVCACMCVLLPIIYYGM